MKKQSLAVTVALLVLLSVTAMASSLPQQAQNGSAASASGRYDQQIQQAVSQKIHGAKQLQNINASVEDGIVTLTGTVGLYEDKLAAEKKIRKVDYIAGIRNNITVAGKDVPDAQLQQKLAKKVEYDRVGYYDNTFNYIAVAVNDGVVTLSGAAYWGVPVDDAIDMAARTAGVKDVVNNVRILPTSQFDDSIRARTARAIYRDSVLGRYGSDPAHPIRIVVDNGHVTLYGSVENAMDKTLAGLRANAVPGSFSVDNKLVVN